MLRRGGRHRLLGRDARDVPPAHEREHERGAEGDQARADPEGELVAVDERALSGMVDPVRLAAAAR
jgi:hypothetical protein